MWSRHENILPLTLRSSSSENMVQFRFTPGNFGLGHRLGNSSPSASKTFVWFFVVPLFFGCIILGPFWFTVSTDLLLSPALFISRVFWFVGSTDLLLAAMFFFLFLWLTLFPGMFSTFQKFRYSNFFRPFGFYCLIWLEFWADVHCSKISLD